MSRLTRLLRADALADAESITGKSYKDDEDTMRLGFGMHLALAKAKQEALIEARDSYFAMDLAETLSLYADMGFQEVLCDEFTGHAYGGEAAPAETFRILWRSDGVLATVESYQTVRRNNTKVYYNVAIRDRSEMWTRTSSGSMTEGDVWVGDHDAREGIRTNLARLAEVGDFLPVWVQRPWLWLLTYSETEGDYDYAAINQERISRLPVDVRDAIGGVQ